MNSRERIQAAIRYQPPDRLPCHDSFWQDTPAVWREQGMPADVPLEDFFGFDIAQMFLDASPRFEQRLLSREDETITYEDRFGYTVKKMEKKSGTMDFLCHVTADRDAWEKNRHRFSLSDDPDAPARIDDRSYFAHFDAYPTWEEAALKYRNLLATERYLLFIAYGPWEATWRHHGYESLLYSIALEPEWIHEMAETYQDLVIAILQRCLEFGMKPDGFFICEDLAHNTGLLLSPRSWRKVSRPGIERLGEFLNRNGIDFWLHSDGNPCELLDDLIECGVRVLNPLQASAGMDIRTLHAEYKNRLAFHGNTSVQNLIGTREALEEEIHTKVPLACQGGYILHSDHSVPPQVDFERYQWYLQTARDCFDRSR